MGTFELAGQIVEVTINGNGLQFRDINEDALIYPNFGHAQTIKEFPDLKDDPEWQVKAGKRFIEFFQKIEGERNRLFYIQRELAKQGYKGMYYQQPGFRTKKFEEIK